MMLDYSSLLEGALVAAKQAGEALLIFYNSQKPLDIKLKQDDSPVTSADLAAHQLIVDSLTAFMPHIPILSEEDPHVSFDERKKWPIYWLVDPLDGTQEFIHRTGQFTVNIALIENGLPTIGVIFVPLLNLTYFAAKQLGCYKQAGEEAPIPLSIRPWQQGNRIVMVVTRKEILESLEQALSDYELKITYRSSSLKFCLLAEGGADIYLRKNAIYEWDTGAGQCIVEQAGGIVLDSNWHILRYNSKPHLLNPPFIALGDSKQLLPLLKTMPMF